ncbi:hypothetical protein ZWY2020_048522 [Hordeum vulgare]|nr:hypothetical protein ZWY2020_048522 [Hordeum vulgare]
MELARRAAPRTCADDIYGIPIPSPNAQMTIQELHRELLQEQIRQRVIVAELAKQQQLEADFQRELLYRDVDARFRQITMPRHGTSPLPHDEPRDVPVPLARRPVKDRIEEWYQPPWCSLASEEDEPMVGVSGCLSFICSISLTFTIDSQYVLNSWDAAIFKIFLIPIH